MVIAIALPAGLVAGNAEAAAFCAYAGGWAGYENCGYHTWGQCLLAVNGRGGQCMRNPHEPALWGSRFDRNYERPRVKTQ